jgi:hypothetical protein
VLTALLFPPVCYGFSSGDLPPIRGFGWVSALLFGFWLARSLAFESISLYEYLQLFFLCRRADLVTVDERHGVSYERLGRSAVPWRIDGYPAAWRRRPEMDYFDEGPTRFSWRSFWKSRRASSGSIRASG